MPPDTGIGRPAPQAFFPNRAARGYGNSVEKRRIELRRMATTQIEAIERKAITQIELSCLEAQTHLAVAGLTSGAAKEFIEKLPSIDVLMPRLSFSEVAGEAEPPIAEQLVSPNALRQRRHRERQKALRNGPTELQALQVRVTNAESNATPPDDGLDIPDELRRRYR